MKRLLCAALTLALALSFAGCAAIFDREIYVVEEYEAPVDQPESEDEAAAISNYAALRRAIVRLVAEHAESAQLQFQNYDGSISQDISTACWEVKSSTALGAFAVDYISYDLSRIVSYYQAEIFITYKRAAWQVDARETASNVRALSTRLAEALRGDETYLVVELNSAAINGDIVRDAVSRAYYADPLVCPVLPNVETGIFPESGVTHILEITIDYGMDAESLDQRRAALSEALDAITDEITDAYSDAERLALLQTRLLSSCEISADAGNAAWDALAGGAADSEGAAMAYEAGCQALGYACVTVAGRLDGEPHFWNIVSFGGASYHVDVSAQEAVFLLGDEAMLSGGYWWDNSEYPDCEAAYTDAEATGEMPSDEPAA